MTELNTPEIAHYIGGGQQAGAGTRTQPVYNPATGQVNGTRRESEGFIYWCKRGHYIHWQDNGLLRVDINTADVSAPPAAAEATSASAGEMG